MTRDEAGIGDAGGKKVALERIGWRRAIVASGTDVRGMYASRALRLLRKLRIVPYAAVPTFRV